MPRRATLDDYERRLLRVQQVLADHLDDDVAPAELARVASFSLHHFHRIFRARLGETVMQHVRRLRLERAARRLRASDVRILELALEAGYESHEAFTRAFTDRFGIAPSEYREQPNARLAAHAVNATLAPTTAVTIRELPAQRVAFMRHRGGYATIGAFWGEMYAWIARRQLAPVLYGLCPDDPDVTPEALLRFDACVAVDEAFTVDDRDRGVAISELPAGTYAIGIHVGPFSRLADTYLDVIGRWFPTSGYELAADATVVEHYLDDPAHVAPDQLRTEVRVRIADES